MSVLCRYLVEKSMMMEEDARESEEAMRRAMHIGEAARHLNIAVESSVSTVLETTTLLRASAEQLREAAELTAGQLETATTSSAGSSDSVRIAAAAAEELNSVIADISQQISQGSSVTAAAVTAMDTTRELVGVLLQPKAVPACQWTRHVLDSEEGRGTTVTVRLPGAVALLARPAERVA